jgi:hypothetical protein
VTVYRTESWFHDGLEVRPSPIQGFGLFTTQRIRRWELVMEWGGIVTPHLEDLASISAVQLSDGRFMGDPPDAPAQPDWYLNHTCDSNLGMSTDVHVVARRDIDAGEELTLDYALFRWGEICWNPRWAMKCTCAVPGCRKIVTSVDFLNPYVIRRYADYFAPYMAVEQYQRLIVPAAVLPQPMISCSGQ